MYQKYNSVLRFFSGASRYASAVNVPFLQKQCEQLGLGKWEESTSDGAVRWVSRNNYATSIHAINSCVLKLSKLTVACKVWRGFSGATLPTNFFEANAEGVRGGIEYGFSSTTIDRLQAMHYASGKASTIFEMDMGLIDRGANLSWLSQCACSILRFRMHGTYGTWSESVCDNLADPHEKEILFPPLMGQQALSTRVHGATLTVEMRLNLNMQSLTLEEVLSKRRKLLEEAQQSMASEVRMALAGTGYEEIGVRMFDAEVQKSGALHKEGGARHDGDWFNDDSHFKQAVGTVVDAKQASMLDEDARLRWMAREMSEEEISRCTDLLRGAIQRLYAAGFTVKTLRAASFSTAELRVARFSVEELRAEGVTLEDLRAGLLSGSAGQSGQLSVLAAVSPWQLLSRAAAKAAAAVAAETPEEDGAGSAAAALLSWAALKTVWVDDGSQTRALVETRGPVA